MGGDIEPLAAAGTFMGIEAARTVRPGQAAILGVPFDCGSHPTRIGCRLGPRAIREQSSLVRPFYPVLSDSNVLQALEAIDLGDVVVTCGAIDPSFAAIEQAVDGIMAAGGTPVSMGGDGSVSLPQLRAVHGHCPNLVVLHIDAHTDSYPVPGYNTMSTFTRAAEEGIVETARSFHIGARGTLPMPGVYNGTRRLGYNVITGDDLARRGLDSVMDEVRSVIGGRPVYLCFDMDYFDPSAAPGVATPTWGGPPGREVFDLLHRLRGLKLAAIDVNTVSPPHDVGGMTAYLAATVILIGLHLVALSRNVA
jgi:agmatinase